jgi:hypothetical protein
MLTAPRICWPVLSAPASLIYRPLPRVAPLTRGRAAAEAPTLLDTLARAPAAAALVGTALGLADRRALRLAHPQLRDAIGEATKVLDADLRAPGAPRPPTARRWPRLRVLRVIAPGARGARGLGRPARPPPRPPGPRAPWRRCWATRPRAGARGLAARGAGPLEERGGRRRRGRPLIARFAQRGRLRRLALALCLLGAAGFKALAEAARACPPQRGRLRPRLPRPARADRRRVRRLPGARGAGHDPGGARPGGRAAARLPALGAAEEPRASMHAPR